MKEIESHINNEIEIIREREFYLERPLWVRDGVMLPEWMSSAVLQRMEVLREQQSINPFTNDWSGFRNGDWVADIRKVFISYFQNQIDIPVNIDWSFSSTSSLLELYLEILRIRHSEGMTNPPKVYYGQYDDSWKLAELESITSITGTEVFDSHEADIIILTHGTPFLGRTSLLSFDANELESEQFIIIDSAFAWSSLLTDHYREFIQKFLERGNCAISGDFHKYIGYAIPRSDGYSATNFSFTIYSEDFFQKRLSLAGEPELQKSNNLLDHFRTVSSRTVISGFPACGLLPSYAFFSLYGKYIPEWTNIALSVASKLRDDFRALGGLTNVLWQIQPDTLSLNRMNDSFLVSSKNLEIQIENVLPTIPMNNQLYAYVHIPPLYGLLGENRLYNMYLQIISHFHQRGVENSI